MSSAQGPASGWGNHTLGVGIGQVLAPGFSNVGRLRERVNHPLLYLATRRITRQWNAPIWKWAKILNELAIRFEGRFEL